MRRILLVTLLGLGLTLPMTAVAQSSVDSRCTDPGETSCVDWEAGIAIATGMGAPASFATSEAQRNITAQRAAKLDAARNLLELMKGVNLSSSTTTRGAMVESDTINASIQGRLMGLRPVGEPRYFSDGSVQVKLEARLREVIPPELFASQAGAPQPIPGPFGSGAGSRLSADRVYTGLIVDARGTDVTPAMSPKIYDPEQREVYGSAYVSREFAVTQGMAGYVKSVERAQETDRVKGNPAMVKALKASGANNADLVVSQEDADTLRKIARTQNFLSEGRVMIVLD